jgi:hypothetical protein
MKLFKQFLIILTLCSINNAYCQIKAKAAVDHIKIDGIDTQGNINLTVSGGTSPYTYSWSPGGSTSKDRTNASSGSYTVKITDNGGTNISYYYNLGYKTDWYNHYGTKFQNDTLKTNGVSGFVNRTALTKNTLRKNTNGWSEFVIPAYTNPYLIGFLDSAIVANQGDHTDIDFGFHVTTGYAFYAWAAGNFYYYGSVSEGDVIKIERTSTTFYLKKNNTTIHTASAMSSKLKVKGLISGATLGNVGVSFSDTSSLYKLRAMDVIIDHITANGVDSIGNIKPQISTGSLPYSYSWTPTNTSSKDLLGVKSNTYTIKVKDGDNDSISYSYKMGYKTLWKSYYGSRYSNDTIYAVAANTPTGSSSAIANNELRPYKDGWTQFIIPDFVAPYVLGYLDSNSVASSGDHYDLDFALHVTTGQALYIYKNANFQYLGTVKKGDVMSIEKSGSTFNLKKNGTSLTTGTALNHKNYKIKTTINSNFYLSRMVQVLGIQLPRIRLKLLRLLIT